MKTKRTRDPTWHSMMMLGKFAKLCSPVFSVEVRRDAVGRKQEHFALGQHPCPRVWLSLALISNDETRRPRYPLGHSQRGLGLLSGSMVGCGVFSEPNRRRELAKLHFPSPQPSQNLGV